MVSVNVKPHPDLNIQVVEHNGLMWYDLRHPGTAEMEFLKANFPFHPLDLEDCRSRVQLPKLDEYPSYIFMVLHFPLFDSRQRLTRPSQMAVFAGASYIVTVHSGDLRPLTKLFNDAQVSEEVQHTVMARGSGFLLYTVLGRLVDYCGPILNKLISNVDNVEAQVLDRAPRVLQELAITRRDILSYRRVVRPQIQVLERLETKEYSFLRVDEDVYFGDLADHMRRLWVELEELKEVSEGLQETHAAVTSQHTNEVTRVLTVFASIMLPLTVITGLYGMNVTLPGGGGVGTFTGVVLGMVLLAGGMLAFFWRRGWL